MCDRPGDPCDRDPEDEQAIEAARMKHVRLSAMPGEGSLALAEKKRKEKYMA